ncbi:MAG: hypothetical protein J6C37_10915, partial [Roseburia sp.]|nr:hypothetical protein [Roseburia sp.]
LKNPAVDFPDIAREREIDIAICEAAHFPVMEYETVLSKCKIKKVCMNHYISENIPGIRQLAKNMGEISVIISNDGMEIEI